MGLRLKCPGCNAKNPLSLRVCPACGRSLDNLAPEQRVYVIEPLGAATPPSPTPKAAPPAPKAAPAAQASSQAPKKPKKPGKKKA
jgi:hypothetical protein